MKEKTEFLSFFALSLLVQTVFHFGCDGYKDRDQFVCFLDERIEFFGFDDPRFDQQFKPVGGFVEFL
jgi:hypothetical protein